MKKRFMPVPILILVLSSLVIVPCSCSHRNYPDCPEKVTRAFQKPPKKWKKPKSRYLLPQNKPLK